MCAFDLRREQIASCQSSSVAQAMFTRDQQEEIEVPDLPKTFIRQIYENAFFCSTEVDEAFGCIIDGFKRSRPDTYDFFLCSAKKSHTIRAAWKLILIDALIGIEFAKQSDEEFYFATLPALFPGRRVPGGEAIVESVLERYGSDVPSLRLIPLKNQILGSASQGLA